MINTFFSNNTLVSWGAFATALFIGFLFGYILERAGFGSSRRLSGVFYFTDMSVIKVMFSALITSAITLALLDNFSLLSLDKIYLLPTIYGAYIVGGIIFGLGFVMAGWCPGTAVVGAASGKWDALVFLLGGVIGIIGFNESYDSVTSLVNWGNVDTSFLYEKLFISRELFILLLSIVGIMSFVFSESIERKLGKFDWSLLRNKGLKRLGLGLLASSFILLLIPHLSFIKAHGNDQQLLESIELAQDHMELEDLADQLMMNDGGLLLVDIRPPDEFTEFHIRGAQNIPLNQVLTQLSPYKMNRIIVLYSNGMTHPAQARDVMVRQGWKNVYILTDGLDGFKQRILKPASLRREPLSEEQIQRINNWRRYFLNL